MAGCAIFNLKNKLSVESWQPVTPESGVTNMQVYNRSAAPIRISTNPNSPDADITLGGVDGTHPDGQVFEVVAPYTPPHAPRFESDRPACYVKLTSVNGDGDGVFVVWS